MIYLWQLTLCYVTGVSYVADTWCRNHGHLYGDTIQKQQQAAERVGKKKKDIKRKKEPPPVWHVDFGPNSVILYFYVRCSCTRHTHKAAICGLSHDLS